MKAGSEAKLGMAVAASFFALSMYAMAHGHSGGPKGYGPSNNPGVNAHASAQGKMRSQFGRNTAANARLNGQASVSAHANVKTSPTPPGHHYGWQKGKHNPHRSPTP